MKQTQTAGNRVKLWGIAGIVLLSAAGISFVVTRLLQMIWYFDSNSGILRRDEGADLLGWVLLGFLCLALLAAVPVTIWIRAKEKGLPAPTLRSVPAGMGVGFFVMGICFLVQSVDELLNGYEMIGGKGLDVYSMIVTIMGFCSALIFILGAYRIVAVGKEPGMAALMVPVIWNLLLLIRLMWSAPEIVSVQSAAERTMAALASMLYFYLMLRRQVGVKDGWINWLGRYLLTLSPFILLGTTLPYLLGWFFNVRDAKPTVPHTALLGVAVALFFCLAYALRGKFEQEEEPAAEGDFLPSAEEAEGQETSSDTEE